MSNKNYNNQTNPNRQKLMDGGRAKKMGGGMMRRDMQSGYYPSDMGMAGELCIKKVEELKRKVNFQIIQVMVKLLKKIF